MTPTTPETWLGERELLEAEISGLELRLAEAEKLRTVVVHEAAMLEVAVSGGTVDKDFVLVSVQRLNDAALAPDAPTHGGPPMTLREVMEAEGPDALKKPWWKRMTVGDIAAELSATFDLGLPVCTEIAKWILAPDPKTYEHDPDPILNPGFEREVGADVFRSWMEEAGAIGVEKDWHPVRFRQDMRCPLCHEVFDVVVTANVRGAAWMADLSAVVPGPPDAPKDHPRPDEDGGL